MFYCYTLHYFIEKYMKKLTPSFLEVHIANYCWKLEKPASLEALWDTMTQQELDDERIPYWVEVWDSSLVLAEFLNTKKNILQGKHCLDIGCGLGVTSLIPSTFGTFVYAMDYQINALLYLKKNIKHNKKKLKTIPTCLATDWRYPAFIQNAFTYIWAADILYERAFLPHIVNFINFALKKNGVFWLSDYDRGFQEIAITHFLSQKFIVNTIQFQNSIVRDTINKTITLFEIRKEVV